MKSNGPSKDMLQLDCSLYKRVNHRLRTETPSTRFIYAWYHPKRSTGAAPDWSNVLATFIVNSILIRASLRFQRWIFVFQLLQMVFNGRGVSNNWMRNSWISAFHRWICMTAPSKRARTVVVGAYVSFTSRSSQYRKKFRPLLPQMRRPALVPLGHHLYRQQGSSTSRRTSKAAAVAAAAVAPTAAIYVKLFSLYKLALVYGANQDRCLSLRVESL